LRGKPLSRGPPRPFWDSKPHERSEGGLEPQKGRGGPRLSGFPLNLIILMKTPGLVVIYRLISCSTK